MFSCSENEAIDKVTVTGELSVVVTLTPETKDVLTAFTGNDIKSFNLATREIVFVDPITVDSLRTRITGLFATMTFYLNERPLLDSVCVYSPLASFYYNDLTFVSIDSKCYLLDGFPASDNLGA